MLHDWRVGGGERRRLGAAHQIYLTVFLTSQIKALSDEYQALLYADIDERVGRYVHQAALDARREITMTQQELADEIGASRANVARALGKLARRGVVRLGQRGRIEIVDSAELGVD